MTTFTDNFTGTAGDDLGARTNWTLAGGTNSGAEINASNQLRVNDTSAQGSGFLAPDTGSTGHYAKVTVLAFSNGSMHAIARMVDRLNYGAALRVESVAVRIYERNGGAPVLVTSLGTHTFASGDVYEIQMDPGGTTGRVLKNGTQFGSDFTASLNSTATLVGINARSAALDPFLDDWESGPLGSVGTTYNDTIADSVTAGDSLASTHAALAAVSDSITAGDSLTVGATMARAIADAITPADVVAAIATMARSISDSVTAGDAVAGDVVPAGAFNDTIADSVTAGDAVAVGASTFNVAISDSLTMGDALATTATMGVSVSDEVTLADAVATGSPALTGRRQLLIL